MRRFRASRFLFAANSGSRWPRFDRGRRESCLQRYELQKQPCPKIAFRLAGNTRSGDSASERRCGQERARTAARRRIGYNADMAGIARADRIERLLREHGILPTRQRVAIGRVLFARHQHLSAPELHRRVRRHDPALSSRSTVYNTLELFARHGLVRELSMDSPQGKLRLYDTNLQPHHHLYHIDTGEIEDLDSDQVSVRVPQSALGRSRLVGVDVTLRVSR